MDFVKRSKVTYYDSTGNKTVSDFIGIEWNKILEKGEDPAAEVILKYIRLTDIMWYIQRTRQMIRSWLL
jgi:hypothetical protein